jgi:hypothetical protein
MKKEELTRRILAVDDRRQTYTIKEFTEFVLSETFNQSEWQEGTHRFELEDGTPVNQVSDEFFEVVGKGITLRPVDIPEST